MVPRFQRVGSGGVLSRGLEMGFSYPYFANEGCTTRFMKFGVLPGVTSV